MKNQEPIPDCRSIHQQLSAEAVKKQLQQAERIEALQYRVLGLQGELMQARAETQRIESRMSKALVEAHDAMAEVGPRLTAEDVERFAVVRKHILEALAPEPR